MSPGEEELLRDFERVTEELDKHNPTKTQINEHSQYTYIEFVKAFGNYNGLLEAFSDYNKGQRTSSTAAKTRKANRNHSDGPDESIPTKDELMQELYRIAEAVDRLPTKEDIRDTSEYRLRHYRERYGGFKAAITRARYIEELVETSGESIEERTQQPPETSSTSESGNGKEIKEAVDDILGDPLKD